MANFFACWLLRWLLNFPATTAPQHCNRCNRSCARSARQGIKSSHVHPSCPGREVLAGWSFVLPLLLVHNYAVIIYFCRRPHTSFCGFRNRIRLWGVHMHLFAGVALRRSCDCSWTDDKLEGLWLFFFLFFFNETIAPGYRNIFVSSV